MYQHLVSQEIILILSLSPLYLYQHVEGAPHQLHLPVEGSPNLSAESVPHQPHLPESAPNLLHLPVEGAPHQLHLPVEAASNQVYLHVEGSPYQVHLPVVGPSYQNDKGIALSHVENLMKVEALEHGGDF